MSQKHFLDLCGLHTDFGCQPIKKMFLLFLCKIRHVKTSIRDTSIEIVKNISYNVLMNTKARWCYLQNEKYISFFSQRKKVILDINAILYAIQDDCKMKLHTKVGEIYETRMTLCELEKSLGDEFIKLKRNTIVRASAIETVADSVTLKNGDTLKFAARQKQRIIDEVLKKTAQPLAEEKIY